jgi:hypothetical protein
MQGRKRLGMFNDLHVAKVLAFDSFLSAIHSTIFLNYSSGYFGKIRPLHERKNSIFLFASV